MVLNSEMQGLAFPTTRVSHSQVQGFIILKTRSSGETDLLPGRGCWHFRPLSLWFLQLYGTAALPPIKRTPVAPGCLRLIAGTFWWKSIPHSSRMRVKWALGRSYLMVICQISTDLKGGNRIRVDITAHTAVSYVYGRETKLKHVAQWMLIRLGLWNPL